jgi:hypothetical protein
MTPPGGWEALHPTDPRRAAAPPPSATRSLRPARQRDCHPSAPELLDRQPVAARRAFCTNAYPAIAHPARRSWLNPRIGRTRLQPAVVRLEAIAGVPLGSMPGHWRQLALGDPAGHVAPGRLMPAQPHDHDPVQCRVGLAVTAPVEPVPHGLPEDASTGAPHSIQEELEATLPVSRRARVRPLVLVEEGHCSTPQPRWPKRECCRSAARRHGIRYGEGRAEPLTCGGAEGI